MRTKATYKFIEFVRPDHFPYPYSLEQAFGVLRWMIDRADPQKYRDMGRWGVSYAECLLSLKPSCTGITTIRPITSLEDLRRRFHYALLSDQVGPNVARWRLHNDITVNGSKIIHFPHAAPMKDTVCENDIRCAFDRVFSASGRLNLQLNQCHNRAREIYGVHMEYCRTSPGWRYVLNYGFGGSVWHKTIARQRPAERLIPVLHRAVKVIDEWTHKA